MADVEQRSRYDGTMVFLADVARVEPGDILLTRNPESEGRKDRKQSSLIRSFTRGTFSHAMMCSTPPTFVEAIGTGVSTLSLARCFAHDLSNVRLLRHPEMHAAATAAKLVQYEIGRDYSVARAVGSVFPPATLRAVEDHGIFCSALVAQVFKSAGSGIFGGLEVDRTTPATIERLAGLKDITAGAFRQVLAPGNIETMSALDGDRVATPSAAQTVISARCARLLWPSVEAISARFPDLGARPAPTFYGILKFVTEALDAVGRIDDPRRARDAIVAIGSLDSQLATFVERGELADLLDRIAAEDDATVTRYVRASFDAEPNVDLSALRSYLVAGEKQLREREEGVAAWEAWGPGRSLALAAYLPIDRKAIEATRRRNASLAEILARCESSR